MAALFVDPPRTVFQTDHDARLQSEEQDLLLRRILNAQRSKTMVKPMDALVFLGCWGGPRLRLVGSNSGLGQVKYSRSCPPKEQHSLQRFAAPVKPSHI